MPAVKKTDSFRELVDRLDPAQLPDSGVTAGTYANATVTVDVAGRVTAAAAGTGGGAGGGVTLPIAESDVTGLAADLAALGASVQACATEAWVAAQGYLTAAPVTSVAGRTGAVTLAEADVAGLAADLAARAPLASPAFTGSPAGPTPTTGDDSTRLATTAFVQASIAGLSGGGAVTSVGLSLPGIFTVTGSPVTGSGTLAGTLAAQAANLVWAGPASGPAAAPAFRALAAADIPAIGEGQVTNLVSDLAAKAPLDSPSFTGSPAGPTPAAADNTTKLATTAYVQAQGYATQSFVTGQGYVTAATAPVTSVAGRTGAVTLAEADVSGLAADLAACEKSANKGAANGYASLDGTGHVPNSQLPAAVVGALQYQGTWDAGANSPALASGVGTKGYFYKVSAAGGTALDGNAGWHVGDLLIFDGTVWDKVDNYEAVTSVAGRTGAVTLAESDVSGLVADLAARAPLASPAFTGSPAAPTPAGSDSSTRLATTAWVVSQAYLTAAPVTSVAGRTGAVTLAESDVSGLVADLAARAPLASPTFTGAPAGPTPATADSSAALATTAYVQAQGYATQAWVATRGYLTAAVTSVGLTLPGIFTVSNSPVTASGTLTAGFVNVAANLFFSGPASGAAAGPAFRTIAARDLPGFDSSGYGFPHRFTFVLGSGTPVTAGADKTNWLVAPRAGKLVKAFLNAKTGPAGAALIVDVLKSANNGANFTSVWSSTPSNRVQLAAGSASGTQTAFDTAAFAEGDLYRVDVAQVGSTVAGQDVTLVLLAETAN